VALHSWRLVVFLLNEICIKTGGRQLDFAPSGIEILPEVMDALKQRGLNRPGFEV
jgi:hypothetical protein